MDGVITDSDRIDWLAGHPVDIRWNHERGYEVRSPLSFGKGKTFREAVDDAIMRNRRIGEIEDPYGRCPHCGAKCVERERRLRGNDKCANGHVYPSSAAVELPTRQK
jgi:hypothetical protein